MERRIARLLEMEELPKRPGGWIGLFLRDVIFRGLLKDSSSSSSSPSATSSPGNRFDFSHFSAAASSSADSNNKNGRRYEPSLPYLFSIRYFPHFYLRATTMKMRSMALAAKKKNEREEEDDDDEDEDDDKDDGAAAAGAAAIAAGGEDDSDLATVMKCFSDPKLIFHRLHILGIYRGAVMHVEEMDSLLDAIKTTTTTTSASSATASAAMAARSAATSGTMDRDEMYREVHRSISECLGTFLQDIMGTVSFKATKTPEGASWVRTDSKTPTFDIEADHPRIISVALEIGRSFHFQGVTLGRREQDKVSARIDADPGTLEAALGRYNFDDDMTELEVSTYLSAQSAFQGALKVLHGAETAIRANHRSRPDKTRHQNIDQSATPELTNDFSEDAQREQRFQGRMRHISEGKATIELYLADAQTTLAYCYEAKLMDFRNALSSYNQALALYSQHVSQDHPTVLHALQSVGSVHIQLKQWRDGLGCLNECLSQLKKAETAEKNPEIVSGDQPGDPSGRANSEQLREIAVTLKNLGLVCKELGDFDAAFDSFSESVDKMNMATKGSAEDDDEDDDDDESVGSKDRDKSVLHDTFLCDAMSKMVDVLFSKLGQLKSTYTRRRLAILNSTDDRFDIQSLDLNRMTCLQVERKATVIARDVVKLRSELLQLPDMEDIPDDQSVLSTIRNRTAQPTLPKWYQVIDYVKDLLRLGKLYFRRRDYHDAVGVWKRARFFLQQGSDPDGALYDDFMHQSYSRYLQDAASELNTERIDLLSELSYLVGVAMCRLSKNDVAVTSFEAALTFLEMKRKAINERPQPQVSEEEREILDLDVGYCEHALGITFLRMQQSNPATSHYREALRLFEAVAARRKNRQVQQRPNRGHFDDVMDPENQLENFPASDQKRADLDVAINGAIASVMLSLGALYHEQQKSDRARRFLDGSIQIVHSVTNKILSLDHKTRPLSSISGLSDVSLDTFVVRVGDAHRRIALMHMEKRSVGEARAEFETAMKYLESTNLETRLTLCVDDEKYLESVEQSNVGSWLLSCYKPMLQISEDSGGEIQASNSASWFSFGRKQEVPVTQNEKLAQEDLLFRLGNVHAKRSEFDQAIQCFREARDLTEERLGTAEHSIIGNILYNLANVYKRVYLSKHDEEAKSLAIESFDESLRIAKVVSGPESIPGAEVMEALSELLLDDAVDDSEYKEAAKHLRDAISIRKMHRSDMSLACAQSLHSLGCIRLEQIKRRERELGSRKNVDGLDEAIGCFSHALRIRKLLLGDHLDVAKTGNFLGVALRRKAESLSGNADGMFEDSLKHLNDALFIRMLFLDRSDEDDPSPAVAKRRSQLKQDLDGAVDIRAIVMATLENMHDVAVVHEAQKNYEIARRYLEDALSFMDSWLEELSSRDGRGMEDVVGSDRRVWSAKLFHLLGVSWYETGEHHAAVSNFEKSLDCQGVNFLETETPDEAFDNFFRQKKPKRGDDRLSSIESAETMEKLASAYDAMNLTDEALRCNSFALRVFGEYFGDESLEVARILKRIGNAYQDRHDYKRCVRALQRALHIRDMFDHVDEAPTVDEALVFVQLARALMMLGAYDQVALDHFYSAVEILMATNKSTTKESRVAKKPKPDKEANTKNELLLECHSSILVLIRRGGTDVPDDEERVCEVLHRIGNAQASVGMHEKALKSLQHVLKFQRANYGDDHVSVADLLFNIGNIYVEIGKYEEARECHQQYHSIATEQIGTESIELAENMICLGNVEFHCKNYSLALDWFDDALRLLRRKSGVEETLVNVLHRKAVAHDKLGDYSRSIDCFGEVLGLGRRLWGPDHLELSNVLNSLGTVHRNSGQLRRALKCFEESLRIRSISGDELSIAYTMNNVGAIFASMDQIDRARYFYATALKVKTEKLGISHVETARSLFNMGQLYMADKQLKNALSFFDEALGKFQIHTGDHDGEIASCLCSIGTVHDELSNEDSALDYFKKALSAARGQNQSVKASALHNVGIILTKRNDIDHAVRIFREALELKANAGDVAGLSDTQYCLANVLRLTGCINEALELHKAALDARIHHYGPSHTAVADSLFGLAQTLVDNNGHADSLEILKQCRRIRLAAYGESSDQVADAVFLLGIVYREVGILVESLSCLKIALDVKASTCGQESLEVADISLKLAIVMCELGKYEDAKVHALTSLGIRETVLGDSHNDVATSMENLGLFEQKLGNHEAAIDWMKKALAIKRDSSGEQHEDISTIVHATAQSLSELGKEENAALLFEDAVRRKKAIFGPKHIEVARVLVDQGELHFRTQDFERALMCYEEAVDTDSFEENTWESGRVFMHMGVTHFTIEKYQDAWDCLTEGTRVFEYVERREKRTSDQVAAPQAGPKKDLKDLMRCYEYLLRLSDENPGRYTIDKALVLPKVAHVLAEIKHYQKASSLYKEAIVLQKSLPGDTRFVVATNLHNLGNCLHQLGDIEEAMICLEDALGLFQEISGVEDRHIADTYHSLAYVHQTRSDLQEALSCYSNALKCRRGAFEAKTEILATLSNMGIVLYGLGMYDASIKSCRDALRLIDTRKDSMVLVVARIVECIGMTHRDRCEYEKSLRCLKECLKHRREAPGMNDFAVAKTLYEMGLVFVQRGEKDEALKSMSEALGMLQNEIGLAAADIANADPKARLKKLTECLRLFVERQHSVHPIDGAETLSILGSLLEHCGRIDESIVCDEIAVKFIEETLSSDHLLDAGVKHRLGLIRFRAGDNNRAIDRLGEALQVRQRKLGDKHVATLETMKALARAYAASGNSEMALMYFKDIKAAKHELATSKIDSDSEADLLLRLGKLHMEQQEFPQALTCFRDSLKLQRKAGPDLDAQKLGDTLRCLGSVQLDLQQYQEAKVTLISALKVIEKAPDDEDLIEELASTTYILGRVNEEEGSFDKALAWFERSLSSIENMAEEDRMMRARIAHHVGMVHFGRHSYDEAMESLCSARDLIVEEAGPSNCDYASTIQGIGQIHFVREDYDSARKCFQRALQIRKEHLRPDDPDLAESLHCLGYCLFEIEHFKPAQSCLEGARQIRSVHAGDNDIDVGETCRYLGLVQHKLGKEMEALDNLLDGIRIGMRSILDPAFELEKNEYDKYSKCFAAAIEMAKDSDNLEQLAKLFHQQGSLQSKFKVYRKAMSSFTEAIQCYKALFGEEHLSVANALFNVGMCLKETDDTERAMKCFTRALGITRLQLGDDHPDVAETMQQIAEVYRRKGDIKGALNWCDQALQIRRSTEDLALASLLEFTGDLCVTCNDGDEAERSLRECIRIRRNVHGGEHLDIANALFSLGRVFETSHRDFKRSLRCYEESLRIRKVLLQDDQMDAAKAFLHLGNVQSALQNDAKAGFCFLQATLICSRIGEANNEIVEDSLIGQGFAYVAQGKCDQALAQYDKARAMRVERSGEQESQDLANIKTYEAVALTKLGKTDAAFDHLFSALDMFKITVGMEHVGTAGCLQQLAELCLDVGQDDDALSHAQQALKIRKTVLSKNDGSVGDSYYVLGKIFFTRREFDAAKQCFEASYDIFVQRRGPLDLGAGDAMFYLGNINELRKDWDEAITCFQRVVQARRKHLNQDNELIAEALFKLGNAHLRHYDFELASDVLGECLRIRVIVNGPDHIDVADTLFHLGAALKDSEFREGKREPSQCFADAIRIYRMVLGENNIPVAKCLVKIGGILTTKNDLNKAGGCYERAVAIFESLLSDDPSRDDAMAYEEDYEAYAATLLDHAKFLDSTGRDGSAMKTYRRALKLYQTLRGKDHEIIGATLCSIARVLGRQERFSEAMQLYGEVLKRRISTVGEEHPMVADVYFGIGTLLDKKRDFQAASSSFEKCIRIRRATLGPWSEEVAVCLISTGVVQRNKGDYEGALESWDEALAIYKKVGLRESDPAVMEIERHQASARAMMEQSSVE